MLESVLSFIKTPIEVFSSKFYEIFKNYNFTVWVQLKMKNKDKQQRVCNVSKTK